VRFDGLFSRFLGETANHLKSVFDQMSRRPAVYFFDEFDAIGKHRGDQHEVGEVRRVVTSFLQLMDADQSDSLIIAATNYEEILDRAVFRRFDAILTFPMPTQAELAALIQLRLAAFPLDDSVVSEAAALSVGLSFADVARACDDAIRTMVLERRQAISASDLLTAFQQLKSDRHRLEWATRD
jgi:SpoVK/Ycf46/Vps4 family AAA+-type ATPase